MRRIEKSCTAIHTRMYEGAVVYIRCASYVRDEFLQTVTFCTLRAVVGRPSKFSHFNHMNTFLEKATFLRLATNKYTSTYE